MLDWILNTPSRMFWIGIYILQKTEGAQLKGKDLFCPSVLQISLAFLLGLGQTHSSTANCCFNQSHSRILENTIIQESLSYSN